MIPLYVISMGRFAGKSALCAGLGTKLGKDGAQVGYIKPVSPAGKEYDGLFVDEDAQFMKEILDLDEPLDVLSPLVLTPEVVNTIFEGTEPQHYVDRVQAAYQQASAGKDVLLMEGAAGIAGGGIVGFSATDVVRLLQPKVLLVVRYANHLSVEAPFVIRAIIGEALVGLVFNAVPRSKMLMVTHEVSPYLERQGIRVFGALPEERVLLSISVRELAECLDGEILNSAERVDELVQSLMVGAMGVDSALDYFHRTPNKAVITGGDRADIQLAALQTSTRCIVLTGNMLPSSLILTQAEDLGIPLILAEPDTLTVVEMVERIFGKSRFHQEKKVTTFRHLMARRFDFAAFYEAMELGIEPTIEAAAPKRLRVAVSAAEPRLDAEVGAHFSETPYFLIVDVDSLEFEAVPTRPPRVHYLGILEAVRLVTRKDVSAVIAGYVGPKATASLTTAGIGVVSGVGGMTVRTAVKRYRHGDWVPISITPRRMKAA